MKRACEILWAAVAEKDLLGIVKYIAEEDAGAALKILNRVKAGTARLDHSPKRGRIVPELLKHGIKRLVLWSLSSPLKRIVVAVSPTAATRHNTPMFSLLSVNSVPPWFIMSCSETLYIRPCRLRHLMEGFT